LSYQRIVEARQTLTAAFRAVYDDGFPGAIEAKDPAAVFAEAKRNLAALTGWLHGDEAWQRQLKEDEL